MKKIYDWDIRIAVRAVDFKKTFKFVLSVHTTAHQICLKVAKELGYDQFSSIMDLYSSNSYKPMRPVQTLYQHNINDGNTVTFKMKHSLANKPKAKYFTKEAKLFDVLQFQKYEPKISAPSYGLIIQGTCQNSKCVNYGKDVEVTLGTGQFSFFQINSSLRCPVCPYRDQYMNPPLVIKGMKMMNCYFRCEGRHRDKTNFIADLGFPLWTKAVGEQTRSFYNIVNKYKWVQLTIYVKGL